MSDGLARTIRKRLAAQGWRIERLATGRHRYWPPDGRDPVIGSVVSSDWRATHHLLADLRRRGFVFEPGAPLRSRRRAGTAPAAEFTTDPVVPEEMEMQMDTPMKRDGDGTNKVNGAPAAARLSFHETLRRARKESSMGPAEVAALVGVAAGTYTCWESGNFAPGLGCYLKLCELYPVLREADPPRRREVKRGGKSAVVRKDVVSTSEANEADVLRTAMQFLLRARLAPWRTEVVNFLDVASAARLSLREVLHLLQ